MVSLKLLSASRRFRPGDFVEGAVEWQFALEPESLEVRLFWYTQGRASQDAGVAAKDSVEDAGSAGFQEFRPRLPDVPYSFSGKLISIVWAVEAVAEPGHEVARENIEVSPSGQEVRLES